MLAILIFAKSTRISYTIPNAILTHKNLFYLFYHTILQYTLHQMFYFNDISH